MKDIFTVVYFNLGDSVRFYNKIQKHITDLRNSKLKHHVKGVLISKVCYKVDQYVNDGDVLN